MIGRTSTATKTAFINTRVEAGLKSDVEKVLRHVGVNTSDAVNMFLQQVVVQQGLPFDVVCTRSHVPNAETRRALREAQDPTKRKSMKSAASTEEMFEQILGKNWRGAL